jgi:serralysin
MSEVIEHSGEIGCRCTACTAGDPEIGLDVTSPDVFGGGFGASADPLGGTTAANGKLIFTADQVAAHLNRTGANWVGTIDPAPQRGNADPRVLTFGFFETQTEVRNNGYVYAFNNQLFGLNEFFNFTTFTAAQRAATREAMQSWDDVANISFVETNAANADINFGGLINAQNTQAYARLPFGTMSSNATVNAQVRPIAGDIWVSSNQANNLFQLDEGGYGLQTLTHEIGHALGLSHPGAYNAAPGVSITYGPNAEYFQDTRAYTVMSYFNASVIGARHFDFHISTTAFAGVPLIHDILAIQRMYGADMTTRTGDTTYGFNSNAGRDAFDFNLTPAPIMAIWDAGGVDTLDASGYATTQLIDLRAGSLSSIGGVTFDNAPSFEQVNANRAAAGFAPIARSTYDSNMALLAANAEVGRLTDNVGIAYGVTIENAKGGSGVDTMIGNEVANVLSGNGGNDILTGAAGDDTLDGGAGADNMAGGADHDIYIVDNAGDLVVELLGEGTDGVFSSIDYTLLDNVENLTLTGSAVQGIGNALDNRIVGNDQANFLFGGAGRDVLIGGDGTDQLVGGAGADIFVAEINAAKVASKGGPISLDLVLDFQKGVDKIDLTGIDAKAGEAGHQAFSWKGHAANKDAGDLSIRTFGNMQAAESALGIDIDGVDGKSPFGGKVTVVFGNTDGGEPDFAVVLVGVDNVSNGDFIFI